MSPRTAKLLSRSLFGLAVVMIAVTGAVAFSSFDDAEPGRIVVVPAAQEEAIRRAAATLEWTPSGCTERATGEPRATDDRLGDAATVYCDLEHRRAEGDDLTPGAIDPVTLVIMVTCLVWLGTGAVISGRHPGNLAGWLFQVVGFALALQQMAVAFIFAGVRGALDPVPLLDVWAMLAEYSILAIAVLPMLWLLFPDGKPPTERWRLGVSLYLVAVALAILSFALAPGPLNNLVDLGIVYMNPVSVSAIAPVALGLTATGVVVAMVIAVASVFGVRGRYRRAEGEERQQLRWLRFVTTVGALLLVLAFGGGAVLSLIVGTDLGGPVDRWFDVFLSLLGLTLAFGLPAAYLVAILRYRLWDLDIVIRKTVQYASVLAAMAAMAILTVVGIPTLLLGSEVDINILMVVMLAAILAVAFTWVQRRARRLADRIVYGKRATPYEVLTEFSGRVGETYSSVDVLPRMAAVLGEGTGAEQATVWLEIRGTMRPEAVWPAESDAPDDLPGDAAEVTHQGELLGALSVTMPASDPMDPAKQQLIVDLAGQAGLVLRNVRLIEELRASRQRLVAAQDEERRRLERNIHDGVQQQLVALQVQLKLARTMVDRDPARAGELLESLAGVSAETLDDLRDLARGIYPPLLADQGLGAALQAQARKAAVPTNVSVDGVGRYPQEVEAAIYFCVLEAMNNVAKYADATSAEISLAQRNGAIEFRVTDDGLGFDPAAAARGTGLLGMADRLEAIGGSVTVETEPGAGTTVSGSVSVGNPS